MSIPVLILGAGGHAKVLIDALLCSSAVIAGIVDSSADKVGTVVLGVPVIGDDSLVDQFPPSEVQLVNGLGSVSRPAARQQMFERFKDRGYSFARVVHPSAIIAADAVIGEGAQIMAGAVIQPSCRLGHNSILNTKASIDHDCNIGDHVHLAPGVTLSGGVAVGEGSHIGTGATVIQGITIGTCAVVAAGAVVTQNVNANAKVRGVPAREFT